MSEMDLPEGDDDEGADDAALEDADEVTNRTSPEGNPDVIGGPGRTESPPD